MRIATHITSNKDSYQKLRPNSCMLKLPAKQYSRVLKRTARSQQKQYIRRKSNPPTDKLGKNIQDKKFHQSRVSRVLKRKSQSTFTHQLIIEDVSLFQIGFILEGLQYSKYKNQCPIKISQNSERKSSIIRNLEAHNDLTKKFPQNRYLKYNKLKNRLPPKSMKTNQSLIEPKQNVISQENFWKNKELIDNQLNIVKCFLKKKSSNLYRSLENQLDKNA